jgi:hypothetical protein
MGTWKIKVARGLIDGGVHYTINLAYRGVPGVTCDWTLAYPTQADVLAQLGKKLTINVTEGEAIEFLGQSYATVEDAIAAVTKAQPRWR